MKPLTSCLRVVLLLVLGLFCGAAVGRAAADNPFDGVFDLDHLDGTNGFAINGVDPQDHSGESVRGAGDVNGDGIDDVIVGAPGADPNGIGESYVVFGSTGPFAPSIDLRGLTGTNGFTIIGVDPGDNSGHSVSAAGDINSDGVGDLIIGAWKADLGANSSAGESYVVFGSTTGFTTPVELGDLDGSDGFVINGIDADDYSGASVDGAGDVNGDGIDDVVIGARSADADGFSDAGESYVVFGSDREFAASLNLSGLDGDNGFRLDGIDPGDHAGNSVSAAGDVNADGVDDLIIGGYEADPDGTTQAGESYVVFGSTETFAPSMDLRSLNGAKGFVIEGIDIGDHSGSSVSAGDINGDGVSDLIIGAPSANPGGTDNAGASYVVFGSTGGFAASMDLDALDGTDGFVINGIDVDDFSGHSVSNAGDVNGDGVDDLIIGAEYASPGGNTGAGESYVVFGVSGFTWTPLGGGNFDTGANWLIQRAPGTSGGVVIIRPEFGGTVNGPAGRVIADRLTLGVEVGGRTSLVLPTGSLLVVNDRATIEPGGHLTGDGTIAVTGLLVNAGEIHLGTSSLQLIAESLSNTGLLRGVGTVDAEVSNNGRIEALDQGSEIDFLQSVENRTPGLIAMRDSAVRFRAGLDNVGDFLISDGASDIFGDVANTGKIGLSSGATVSLVGSLAQNGTVNLLEGSRLIIFDVFSGTGGIQGGGMLEILGTLSPGASPGAVDYDGDLQLGPGATTLIELAGLDPGEFDQLLIGGDLTLAGELDVDLLGGFEPGLDQQFLIADVTGQRFGVFSGLGEGALVGNYQGTDLFITYAGGDGNDVALVTPVPEPSTLVLAAIGLLSLAVRRRRSGSGRAA